jgi:hypothetical protein
MPDRGELARYRANWQGEVDRAALYRTLAEVERQPQLAEVYRRLVPLRRHTPSCERRSCVPPASRSRRAA